MVSGMVVSIVVPVYNEQQVLAPFFARLHAVLRCLPQPYEVIFVDDGSQDATFESLLALRAKDRSVKIIRLARNFGHQVAISAGLERSRGEYVAVMDGDLQDPPEVLPAMLGQLQQGYDIAYGVRSIRKDEGWLKRSTSFLFYRLLRWVAEIPIPKDAGDFCMMRKTVVDALNRLPERNRFLRGLRSWFGFKQIGVPYQRALRTEGRTKFTLGRMFRFSLDGIISFSIAPLRLASYLGFLSALVSFFGILVMLYVRLGTTHSIPGFASITIIVLFLGGVQLMTVGLLGEYIGRVYDEVKQRPLYVASEKIGWESIESEESPALSAVHSLQSTATSKQ
ncbi:MAG: glycosyltransferase family 2 protein [Candidatus Omnitrophica bacterium]|nr:glycosyltransferase family 2 protein [Candidatus Omnitrophota bacterium]